MRNFNHHTEDSYTFHNAVVKSKHKSQDDPHYKDRLQRLDERIAERFGTYDGLFATNSLEHMALFPYTASEKKDLLKLYSYRSNTIQSLKQKLTTTETGRIISTCPNCTISEINSFDHYLPQSEYPGFVVNPKNLFPSCTICNGHKNDVWREGGKRQFLNLYLDNLPQEQYLFVEPSFVNGVVSSVRFFLKKSATVSQDLYDIIESHYDKLHLLSRFTNNVHEVVTTLEHSIQALAGNIPTERLSNLIVDKCNRDRAVFGYNYWKSILEIDLATNCGYINRLLGRE